MQVETLIIAFGVSVWRGSRVVRILQDQVYAKGKVNIGGKCSFGYQSNWKNVHLGACDQETLHSH